jgi:hypothetical protein
MHRRACSTLDNRVLQEATDLRTTDDKKSKILPCLQRATVGNYLNLTRKARTGNCKVGTVGMAADGRQRTCALKQKCGSDVRKVFELTSSRCPSGGVLVYLRVHPSQRPSPSHANWFGSGSALDSPTTPPQPEDASSNHLFQPVTNGAFSRA